MNSQLKVLSHAIVRSIVRREPTEIKWAGEGTSEEIVEVLESMGGIVVEAVFERSTANRLVTGFSNGSEFALAIELI